MGLLSFLDPVGLLGGGGGGASTGISNDKTNTSNTSTVSNYSDSRSVVDAGGGLVGNGNWWDQSISVSDSRDLSTNLNVADSSNRSTNNIVSWADSSVQRNSNNTTVTTLDPGALKAMEEALLANQQVTRDAFSYGVATTGQNADLLAGSMNKAYSFAAESNATLGAGFTQLLSAGMQMFGENLKAVNNAGQMTAQAYQTATAEKSGSLDNRTILILGVAAMAAFAFMSRK